MDREKLSQALRLYVVTDRRLSRGRTEEEVAREAIAGGATALQLRGKDWNGRQMFEVGCRLAEICREAGVLFLINDRVDVAAAVDADGVHLGQQDLPLKQARQLLGPDKIIGLTAECPEQARQAELDGADYLGTSAVFPTDTKKYQYVDPLGYAGLREIVQATDLPVVAIGGINRNNAGEIIERTGVCGIAVVSAVVSEPDIAAAAQKLRTVVDHSRRENRED